MRRELWRVVEALPAVGEVALAQADPAAALPSEQGLAAFVDVETTGLSAARDEVIELAAVLFCFRRASGEMVAMEEEFSGLREPARPIPPGATAVHGLTDDDVRGRVLDDARVLALLTRAEFLVAHNAAFDRGFVLRLYPGLRSKPWLCSLRDIDWRRRAVVSQRLQDLLALHGLRPDAAHRALADCRAALQLLGHRGVDGTTYLQEMLRRRGILPAPDRAGG